MSREFLDVRMLTGAQRDEPLTLPWPVKGNPGGFISFETPTQWHSFVSSLNLSADIPEIVIAKYRRAQMLYFLAWIYPDLIKAGEVAGLTTLELALNDRYGGKVKKRGSYRSFADLLKYLLEDGLTDAKMPMVQKYGGTVIGFVTGDIKPGLADRRNSMAHGDPFDGFPIGGLLELVRDLLEFAYRDTRRLE